jgi:hypothetical protein
MIRLAAVFALFLMNVASRGGLAAVWTFWPFCLLILPNSRPSMRIGSLGLTFDRLIGLACVYILITAAGRVRTNRLRFLDYVVIVLIFADIMSEIINQGFLPFSLLQKPLPYVPYLVGRFYLRDSSDLKPAVGGMAFMLTVLGILAIVESVTRLKFIGYLAFGRLTGGEIRYGMMRARVGASHPISLGTTILLVMPWALEAGRMARLRLEPWWWRFAPVGGIAGLIGALSRGPILTSLIYPFMKYFFANPGMRKMMIAGVLAGAGVASVSMDQVVEFLHAIEGSEVEVARTRWVVIEGVPYRYTGTTHRSLLYKVYREPMKQAGAFGFDRSWFRTMSPDLYMRFWSIDNTYIHTRMKRGLVGLLAFDLLLAGTFLGAWRVAMRPEHPLSPLMKRVVASVIAITLALFTVAIFMETRAMLLMTAGLVASLEGLPIREEDVDWSDEPDQEFDDDDDDDDDDAWPVEDERDWPR